MEEKTAHRAKKFSLKTPKLNYQIPEELQITKLHWFFKLTLLVGLIAFLYFLFISTLPNLLPTRVLSNSTAYGIVWQNQIWQGTIKIEGDLFVLPGVSVTIKPGTQVLISMKSDKSNMDFLPWHKKSGINTLNYSRGVQTGEPFWDEKQKIQIHFQKINAIGTKDLPIIIKSDTQDGSPYDFNVISVSDGVFSFVQFSNYRRLEISSNVTIRDSMFDQIGECAICIGKGTPTIINNEFKNSNREGIWIDSGSPRISDNLFINKKGVGIRMDPKYYGEPKILQNTFEMPGGVALDVVSGDEKNGGEISKNIFSGSSVINLPCQSKLKFEYNNLLGLVSFSKGGCASSFTFGTNFWELKDKEAILKGKILNKESGFEVLIPSLFQMPVLGAGRRSN